MQTKPKTNSVCTSVFDSATQTLTFKVLGAGEAVLYLKRTSDMCDHEALIRGYNQRCVNAAALGRDPATGKPAGPEEKFLGVKALVDHYNTGTEDWSPARQTAGPRELDRIILEAVGEVTGRDEAAVRAMVAAGAAKYGVTEHQYLARLGTNAEVAALVAAARAAQVTEFDVDAELMGE